MRTVDALARALSVIGKPPVYATLYFAILIPVFPLDAGMTTLAWAILILAPSLVLFYGIRRGVWSNVEVTDLRERRTYMPWTVLCATASSAVALLGNFPFALRLTVLGIALWLLLSTLIGFWWKISLHVGGVTGLMFLSVIVLGAPALALAWMPIAVAWSRLRLRRHDLLQVIGGGALGTICTFGVLFLLGR